MDIDKLTPSAHSIMKRNKDNGSKFRGRRLCGSRRGAVHPRSSGSKIPKKVKGDLRLRILACLKDDWSPEQIAGRLNLQGIFSRGYISMRLTRQSLRWSVISAFKTRRKEVSAGVAEFCRSQTHPESR
jgi:IS30 family transposase